MTPREEWFSTLKMHHESGGHAKGKAFENRVCRIAHVGGDPGRPGGAGEHAEVSERERGEGRRGELTYGALSPSRPPVSRRGNPRLPPRGSGLRA